MRDPATEYAQRVLDGEIVTGRPVRWACARHLRDLKECRSRGLAFDADEAARWVEFFGLLRHFEGTWGKADGGRGAPVALELWQKFVTGSIVGWQRRSGGGWLRRFRQAWVEVARKQGKSLWAAGMGLGFLTIDGEPGAQIWNAATKLKQARVIHGAAMEMRRKCPELRELVGQLKDRLFVTETHSYFAPLGADSETEDGLNPHVALLDEVHAHPDGSMWDVLESGMAARSQPLILAVTTAGFDRHSFGKQQHDYHRRLLDPASGIENDQVFAYIAELDREGLDATNQDDPYDESVWIKANPNLGVSVGLDYLRARALKAQQNPREENDFLCKNLNVWVGQAVRWIPMQHWDACVGPWAVEA